MFTRTIQKEKITLCMSDRNSLPAFDQLSAFFNTFGIHWRPLYSGIEKKIFTSTI